MLAKHFLDLPLKLRAYQTAKFVVVPVPYEATTTYGQGTRRGPAAILTASLQVENFDEELKAEPYVFGIHTQGNCQIKGLASRVKRHLAAGKTPIILGGEHSITPFVVKAAAQQDQALSVLQLDAHADLRDKYQGKKNNHACVMRRVLEICPAVQVGVRSLSKEEWGFAKKSGQDKKMHWAQDKLDIKKIKNQLSKNVYITIDVDVFDPSLIPAVGTPEPGGLSWYQVLNLLREICQTKNVVGFDVVELSPRLNELVSPFAVAKLVYKVISYLT
ncbi:agmatinase [Candidatus Saganbacteria bacterium CG08_land_8_20_14_0_20_45_16]|uniref:Agmatinase n=1 Tax=Candidatus Saganbacteria bacterium CG08_land_8_20_14_0_20_45_16 TaxID=2014293 RepID=A0A2H0Y197_UNCSA|nr:MAG: agmatinase [Candidatus Saganbacteria bacterium CG08_land_8_20_14_0_20_45_16]